VLACHRNGNVAGTARLILPSALGFPCQTHCKFFDEYSYLGDRLSERLATYSEVSRLAVSKMFRRRSGDSFYGGDPRPHAAPSAGPRCNVRRDVLFPEGPEILLSILKCLYQETKLLGLTHWIIAVERSLHLMLRRMGWPFVAVGPQVDYCGLVRPYLAEVRHTERVLRGENPRLLSFLREGLPHVCDGVDPAGAVPASRSLSIHRD
jgi:N-acyl amino acid synthase of PEP-CTERM/exosortase system